MRALLCLLACCSAPAVAQGVVAPDVASIAAAAQAAQTQAANAQQQAATAQQAAQAAQAAIPPLCAAAPAKDTPNGSVGTASGCTPLSDSTRPTAVQAGNTTLLANCTFSVTFARSFTSATPFVYAAVVDSSGNQMPCKAQTRSATGFTGICAPAQATTLSATIVATGLTVLPFGSTCTAGTPVMFLGREPTQ